MKQQTTWFNRCRCTIGLVFCFLLPSFSAQAQPKLSGYYENTLQATYHEETNETLLDASKLRVDIAAGGKENELEFRGNVNLLQYHGPVTRDLAPFLPSAVLNQMRTLGLSTSYTEDRNRIWLDNAYLSWSGNSIRFRAGKQQLSWGAGYSYNPTDLFHRKQLVDPSYEKEGVTALRLDYRWGVAGQATLIAAPDDKLQDTGLAILLGTHIEPIGYDIAITLHQVTDSSRVLLPLMRRFEQRRQAAGVITTGSLLGLGVWVEGNWNWMEFEDDFARVVAGVDYTLTNGLYMIAEGFYNGRGSEGPPYPVSDWVDYLQGGEPIGAGWFMAGVREDLTMLTSAALYGFISEDGSIMLNPRIQASIAQNADALIFASITTGPDDAAFPPGLYSLVGRITVYF